jgi:cation diffusion facilitator family transporter
MTESGSKECTNVDCACNCERETHNKRALVLSWLTLVYNLGEGVVSIAFGIGAGSTALIGFGLDSFVESLSGGVMIWRFRQTKLTEAQEEAVEKKAARYVAYTLFALGAYVGFESARSLLSGDMPEKSLPGIVIALVSLVTMPLLFIAKHRTGRKLSSRSLLADSKQTLACIFLSIALLAGLGLNYSFGLWWADPAAGLLIAVFIFREGYRTLREEKLCEC